MNPMDIKAKKNNFTDEGPYCEICGVHSHYHPGFYCTKEQKVHVIHPTVRTTEHVAIKHTELESLRAQLVLKDAEIERLRQALIEKIMDANHEEMHPTTAHSLAVSEVDEIMKGGNNG